MTAAIFKTLRISALGLCLFCGFSSALMAKTVEQPLDNIVAVVNETVITQSELNLATNIASRQFSSDGVSMPPLKTLRKQVLQQLINKKLEVEAAEQLGITVEDEEVDQVISRITAENHLTQKEFFEKISQEGLTAKAYRKQIRESLVMQHLAQKEVASHITVSPEEINDSLRTTKLETAGEKEYHIQDILIPVSDTPSPQEIAIAKKFAQDIMVRLRKGTQLNQLASAEAQSLQDNDLGWRKLAEVPTAFTDSVAHLPVKNYAGPIQASNGFHIVHMIGIRNLEAPKANKPQKDEIAQAIFQRKFEEAMQGWITKVRSSAFIEVYDKALV